jgi:hypothetical protein
VDTNDVFKAFFVIDTIPVDTPLIVFNEINYRSADSLDADDWVELWNVDTTSIDLSGWTFKDGNDDHEFIFPTQTFIDTAEFLVLCQDSAKFKSIYPAVQNVIGSFDFGFANEGEDLRLFNNEGMLVVSVLYSNLNPWPTDADGTGRTIELFDPLGDLNDGTNWFSGCIGGSPGGPFVECDTIGILNHKFVKGLKVFPNPFTLLTTFEFNIEEQQEINFEVFNTFGNLVHQQQIEYLSTGVKHFKFERSELDTGIYFYKIYFKDDVFTGKLLVR